MAHSQADPKWPKWRIATDEKQLSGNPVASVLRVTKGCAGYFHTSVNAAQSARAWIRLAVFPKLQQHLPLPGPL